MLVSVICSRSLSWPHPWLRSKSRFLPWLITTSLSLVAVAGHGAPLDSDATRLLMTGHVDEAISQLHSTLAANPHDGSAHLLLCRAFYSEDLGAEAARSCDAAIQNDLQSSVAQDWAGRAFGMQASHAGPLGGLRLARRVKAAFETAVSLDSRNHEAVNDLGEYLIAAPGIVGGSQAEARALADRVQSGMPEQAHRLRALLAEKNRDDAAAEREFRAALVVADSPAAWVDLAGFYMRRHQDDRAAEAARSAIAADKAHGPALVDAASILNDLHREPALALSAVRSYLTSPAQSDVAPAFKAHVLAGKLLLGTGDKVAARAEFVTAQGLAADYAPAKKALAAL